MNRRRSTTEMTVLTMIITLFVAAIITLVHTLAHQDITQTREFDRKEMNGALKYQAEKMLEK